MHIRKRINLKLYGLLSLLLLATCLIIAKTPKVIAVIAAFHLLIIFTQVLWVYIGNLLFSMIHNGGSKWIFVIKIIVVFIFKTALLLFALYESVQLVGNWAIICLGDYLVHVFVFVLSMKRKKNKGQ
ncbi:MAG: hypothetical protein KAQ98_01405 [Bacteriovoracaceae bacterium]|nr:hypothetical protein [Bacteriovoracaceae bacterium]